MIILLLSTWANLISSKSPAAPADDGFDAFADWITAYFNDLIIEAMKAVATSFWFLEKIAAGINRFLTEQDMWERVLDSTLNTLEGTMPTILQGLIFSNSAGGLIYLALFMAGLLMIIPNMSHIRLVEPTRVITWAIVVVVLFISASATSGYDLIGVVERMRAGAVQIVIDSADDSDGLDNLVAQPMMADSSDLENYGFVLATNFENEYFPEATDFEDRNVTLIDATPFFVWQMTFKVESESGQQQRRQKAETGLAISALTIVAAVVLFMFGLIFATLTASALVLIIFFLVALPLGFFEFGASILNGIIKQYAYLWAITLLAVILPGILVAAGTLAYPASGAATPQDIMAFIPILIIVTIATSYVSAMAAKAMTDTGMPARLTL